MLTKSLNLRKTKNVNSDEYRINTKEVDLLNNNISKLTSEILINNKNLDIFIKKVQKECKVFEKNQKKEFEKKNKEIDKVITLLDTKFEEINNYFVNIKKRK